MDIQIKYEVNSVRVYQNPAINSEMIKRINQIMNQSGFFIL